MDTINLSSDRKELHVLAVDDSNIDRKVIEKLLRISSFKGTYVHFQLYLLVIILTSVPMKVLVTFLSLQFRHMKHFSFFRLYILLILKIMTFAVTVVESGSRALQYLGLDDEKNPARFDVSLCQIWRI